MSPDIRERPHGHVEDAGVPEMGVADEVVGMVDAGQVGGVQGYLPPLAYGPPRRRGRWLGWRPAVCLGRIIC